MKKFSEKGESVILHLILASLDLIFFRSTRISKKSNIQYFCSFTVLFFYAKSQETLYKKWSFPLRISSVNVTTSHLLKKSLMKNFIFCAVKIQCRDFKKKTKGSAWGPCCSFYTNFGKKQTRSLMFKSYLDPFSHKNK